MEVSHEYVLHYGMLLLPREASIGATFRKPNCHPRHAVRKRTSVYANMKILLVRQRNAVSSQTWKSLVVIPTTYLWNMRSTLGSGAPERLLLWLETFAMTTVRGLWKSMSMTLNLIGDGSDSRRVPRMNKEIGERQFP